MKICPCCLRPIDRGTPFDELTAARLNPTQLVLIAEMLQTYPQSVSGRRLKARTHLGRNVFGVTMSRLRARLRGVGWTVPKNPAGVPGCYRLERIA